MTRPDISDMQLRDSFEPLLLTIPANQLVVTSRDTEAYDQSESPQARLATASRLPSIPVHVSSERAGDQARSIFPFSSISLRQT
jgi:hypothetical protein